MFFQRFLGGIQQLRGQKEGEGGSAKSPHLSTQLLNDPPSRGILLQLNHQYSPTNAIFAYNTVFFQKTKMLREQVYRYKMTTYGPKMCGSLLKVHTCYIIPINMMRFIFEQDFSIASQNRYLSIMFFFANISDACNFHKQ